MSESQTLERSPVDHQQEQMDYGKEFELQCESDACGRKPAPHKAEFVMLLTCGHSVLGCPKAAAIWFSENIRYRSQGGMQWMCKVARHDAATVRIERI